MLDLLPYHLLKSIYQLLEPSDLSSMMAVQSRELGFINKYRELFRKKAVLLRLKGAADHVLIEVYAAEFSRKSPRRVRLFSKDIKSLGQLPGMSIRTVVVDGTAESNNRLLVAVLERLSVFPECCVTFKNVDFTGTEVEKPLKFLGSLKEIPLFRLKTCIFPSVQFATRLLKDSNVLSKVFSFEDDYSTVLGSSQQPNRLGDELLKEFCSTNCEKMSLSPAENVSWQSVSRFIEGWRKNPREFAAISFIRTAAFNEEVREAREDFTRFYSSAELPGILLRIHLDSRVHAWISTERVI